jgi:hypothetical protein
MSSDIFNLHHPGLLSSNRVSGKPLADQRFNAVGSEPSTAFSAP